MISHVPVRGLFESHLTVSDLQRSVTFYRDVLGLEQISSFEGHASYDGVMLARLTTVALLTRL
jgi:catechol 2,3-dioxygenase-like lactoylglutathione lyase family enzyme